MEAWGQPWRVTSDPGVVLARTLVSTEGRVKCEEKATNIPRLTLLVQGVMVGTGAGAGAARATAPAAPFFGGIELSRDVALQP